MAETETQRRWLVLAYQLPAHPSNLRVRVWRRLQQVGAGVLRNSLYVLPSSDDAREDFNWIREEIVDSGGQASILDASAVDGYTTRELIQQFRIARNSDYEALTDDIRKMEPTLRGQSLRAKRAAFQREVRRFRERLAAIEALDHFAAPARADARQALAKLEAIHRSPDPVRSGTLARRDFRRRVWVTRPRPGIDRMASAWLIRRFISPDARFAFVTPQARLAPRQVPFDMPDVDFGHHGLHCTFETLMQRFAIADAGVTAISRVVHDLDLKEARYAMPECAAVGRLVDGLRAASTDDGKLLEHGIVMIDALYRSFAADGSGRKSVSKRRRTRR